MKSISQLSTIGKTTGAILLAGSTMVASSMATAASLQPSTAKYSFTIENKYNGSATRTLKKSGDTWTYSMNARVAGVATANQTSKFKLVGSKVVPSYASTTYKIFGAGRTHKLNFGSGKVVSTYKGVSKTLSMPRQAYDDMSLEAQIRQELLNGKFSGSYYMAKKDKVEKVTFKKSGTTSVSVPAGTYKAVRIDRVHSDSGRQTTFWLAPSLNYQPVKVIQNADGKKMELKLTSIN